MYLCTNKASKLSTCCCAQRARTLHVARNSTQFTCFTTCRCSIYLLYYYLQLRAACSRAPSRAQPTRRPCTCFFDRLASANLCHPLSLSLSLFFSLSLSHALFLSLSLSPSRVLSLSLSLSSVALSLSLSLFLLPPSYELFQICAIAFAGRVTSAAGGRDKRAVSYQLNLYAFSW